MPNKQQHTLGPCDCGVCDDCCNSGWRPSFEDQYGHAPPRRPLNIRVIDAATEPLRAGYNDVG